MHFGLSFGLFLSDNINWRGGSFLVITGKKDSERRYLGGHGEKLDNGDSQSFRGSTGWANKWLLTLELVSAHTNQNILLTSWHEATPMTKWANWLDSCLTRRWNQNPTK